MTPHSPDKPRSPPVIIPMDDQPAIVPFLNDCVFVLFLALVFGLGPVSIAAYLNTKSTAASDHIGQASEPLTVEAGHAQGFSR